MFAPSIELTALDSRLRAESAPWSGDEHIMNKEQLP